MPRSSRKVNGAKIRELRENKVALQRDELAEILGFTPAAIYEIEVHRQSTSLKTLRRISKILGVKPEELMA